VVYLTVLGVRKDHIWIVEARRAKKVKNHGSKGSEKRFKLVLNKVLFYVCGELPIDLNINFNNSEWGTPHRLRRQKEGIPDCTPVAQNLMKNKLFSEQGGMGICQFLKSIML